MHSQLQQTEVRICDKMCLMWTYDLVWITTGSWILFPMHCKVISSLCQQNSFPHNQRTIQGAKSPGSLWSVVLPFPHKTQTNTRCSRIWTNWQDAQLSSMFAKPCQNSQLCQGKESAKGRVGVRMERWDPHTWKKGWKGMTGWFIQRVRSGWIKL